MSNPYLIALAVVVVAGILLLLYRKNRHNETSRSQDERQAQSRTILDYTKDREDSRLAHMSAEERAWETASLQRNRENQAQIAALAE
jgi:hypothetical protein